MTASSPTVDAAIRCLDTWLQTMRSPSGYTGPIAHWWESSLLYCGPMIDWRYEGIISGYVSLFEATKERAWLDRACEAADYAVAGQLPTGSFRNSSFQYGAIEGGTPHEAGVDVGLLELARTLRDAGLDGSAYVSAAGRNIDRFLIGTLWDGRGFRDQASGNDTLVPNKNATAMEALLLYEELSGRDMSPYVNAALKVILSARVRRGPRAGGTVHTGSGRHRLAIGIYTARSMSAVMRFYERESRDELLDAVHDALGFLESLVTPGGTLFGYYRDGSLIANPRWIAPSGDLLRAAVLGDRRGLAPRGLVERLASLLVEHQLPSGGLPTAVGFSRKGSHTPHRGVPEVRDVLPVVGWCDKAFRGLALLVTGSVRPGSTATESVEVSCTWKGRRMHFQEDGDAISIREASEGRIRYRWRKGQVWPDVYAL